MSFYGCGITLYDTIISCNETCSCCKEFKPVHPKRNQSWIFIGRTDAEAETPMLWPPDAKNWFTGKDWCRERLKAGGEGEDRGWDDWMASSTQWTWIWVSSGSWWWTGRPGVLRFMGPQRVGHDWATDWTELNGYYLLIMFEREKWRRFLKNSHIPISKVNGSTRKTILEIRIFSKI